MAGPRVQAHNKRYTQTRALFGPPSSLAGIGGRYMRDESGLCPTISAAVKLGQAQSLLQEYTANLHQLPTISVMHLHYTSHTET